MKMVWLFLSYFFLELSEVCRSCHERGLIATLHSQAKSGDELRSSSVPLQVQDDGCVSLPGLFRIKAFTAYCLDCGYDQRELLDLPLEEVYKLYDAWMAAEPMEA